METVLSQVADVKRSMRPAGAVSIAGSTTRLSENYRHVPLGVMLAAVVLLTLCGVLGLCVLLADLA